MSINFEVYEKLLSEKLARVKEMHSLTLLWYDLLEKDEIEAIEKGIDERGELIKKAEITDNKLKEIENDPGFSPDSREKQRIDEINKEIRRLKDEMIGSDEKLTELFNKKMTETKEEMKEVRTQKKRTVAYGGLDYSVGSMYFNVKQ
ncbi:MAG: hypothetical protein J1F64_02710 [Oscillospiraceae bacterium]|nr:hypothetical protein [Oscillospiraceae bacterium]